MSSFAVTLSQTIRLIEVPFSLGLGCSNVLETLGACFVEISLSELDCVLPFLLALVC